MLFLKNAAGALRRNLSDTAHHVFSGPHRGWKIALYVAMLVVPGGSLAALGFAWFDQRRHRAAKSGAQGSRTASVQEPSPWPAAAAPAVRCP
ncbi:multidrug ABC transporter ATPase [Burkholderia alba]|uniref:multidrug ABC transporter ATPase n=1 Tax=Burkholderia alba TaxID=2683677 RepID=UPI002B056791|nr:multidrug ABC transporter ATPase [Burkholderia alba]